MVRQTHAFLLGVLVIAMAGCSIPNPIAKPGATRAQPGITSTPAGGAACAGEVPQTTQGTSPSGKPIFLPTIRAAAMVSDSEGWAVGEAGADNPQAGTILHYCGGHWRVANVSVPRQLFAIDMLSPSEGWAVGQDGAIMHFSQGTWQYLVSNKVSQQLMGIAMVSPTEGWAVGQSTGTLGTSPILHYTHGEWTPLTDPKESSLNGLNLSGISMDSASDGWAVGGINGAAIFVHFDGTTWTQVVPAGSQPSSPQDFEQLDDVTMISANDGWAFGPHTWRFHDGTWSSYALHTGSSLTMDSPTDGWSGGGRTGLWHYSNGQWIFVPLALPISLKYPNNHCPNAFPCEIAGVNVAAFSSPTEGWMFGLKATFTSFSEASGDSIFFLHYHNGTWSVFQN